MVQETDNNKLVNIVIETLEKLRAKATSKALDFITISGLKV